MKRGNSQGYNKMKMKFTFSLSPVKLISKPEKPSKEDFKIHVDKAKTMEDVIITQLSGGKSHFKINFDHPFFNQYIKSIKRKLKIYFRHRWYTFLNAIIQTKIIKPSGDDYKEIELLVTKIKEKILFEILNPSSCKFLRSKTPPNDAPRKIRDEYRKMHPEKNEDNFPEIEIAISKDKDKNTQKKSGSIDEKSFIPKITSFIKKPKICLKFPYRELQRLIPPNTINHDPKLVEKLKAWLVEQTLPLDSKVFNVLGTYPDVIDAFKKRGWVENPDKLSPFFHARWSLKQRDLNHKELQPWQIVNHFQRNSEITTKVGLHHNLRNSIWTLCSDIDKFFPQCFDMADIEIPDFIEEFKLGKAESILKLYIKNEKPFNDYGEYKVLQALKISERRLLTLEDLINRRKAIKWMVTNDEFEILLVHKTSENKLSNFQFIELKKKLEKYKIKIQKRYNKSTIDEAIRIYAKEVLNKLKSKYVQFNLCDDKNVWIAKPAGKSRGRGISFFTNLKNLLDYVKGKHYIVQKYIENPLIISDRKFDIRQWVVYTSMNPLIIWMYNECYIRFGAEDYCKDIVGNKFMHLTNNSITKHSQNVKKFHGNMWCNEEFREFIDSHYGKGIWKNKLKQRMIEIIIISSLACHENIIHRNNSFELVGYDFMIDSDLNVWLIEVNSSPACDYSTEVTEKVVKSGIEDLIKLVIDNPLSPEHNSKISEIGNYKKIYEGNYHSEKSQLMISFEDRSILNIKPQPAILDKL